MTALPRFVLHAHVCTFTYYVLHSFACFLKLSSLWGLTAVLSECRLVSIAVPSALGIKCVGFLKNRVEHSYKKQKRCLNQTYWIKVQLLYQYLSISHSCLVFFLVFFISYSLFYLRIYVCIFLPVLFSPTVSIWILNPYLVFLYMCTLIIPALNKFTCVHITV